MYIEVTERGEKEYYDEFLYVASHYKAFKKNPYKKTHSLLGFLNFYIIFVLCAIGLISFFYYDEPDMLYIFLIGMLVLLLIFSVIYRIKISKQIQSYMVDTKRSVTFDDKGITFQDEDKKVSTNYSDIQYILFKKYSIVFFPEKPTNIIMSISIKHKNQVEEAINKYNLDNKVIK